MPSYLKIVGGHEAIPNSWPSIAFVSFTYKAVIGGSAFSMSARCGGTLIDKTTVLTASHCVVKQFDYTTNSGSQSTYQVQVNEFYPTFGSMYTIRLGLHDSTSVNAAGAQSIVASDVIIVR